MLDELRELLATVFLVLGRHIDGICRSIALGLLTDSCRQKRALRRYRALLKKYPLSSSWNPETLLDSVVTWQSKSVLDLGCGQGRESLIFAKAGAVVTGVDSDDTMIRQAKVNAEEAKLQIRFIASNYQTELKLNDTFDRIYFSSAMYSTILGAANRLQILTSLLQHLNERGEIILSVKNLQSRRSFGARLLLRISQLVALLSFNPQRFEPGDKYFFWEAMHVFTKQELEEEVRMAGLKVDHFISCDAMDFHYLVASRA